MKKVFIIMILTFCFIFPQEKVKESKRIKVLTFNILHGATMKKDFNLDVIAKVINDANPDIVALQEVDFKTKRAKSYDLATELGWRTKMVPLFGRAMHYDGGEYGEAILSKYTFINTRNIALPFTDGNEPRAALEVTFVLAEGDTISFVATHLDHLNEDYDRIKQATKINEVFSKNKYPTILAGDLNDLPRSNTINILEKLWTPTYNKLNPEPTYPSDNPKDKIDYIMYYPKERWSVVETRVIQDKIASDHCAYSAILELR